MTSEKIIELKAQIADGEILEALDLLQSEGNDFIVLKAKLKQAIKDQIRGYLEYDKYQGTIASIVYQTLSLLDEIEEQTSDKKSSLEAYELNNNRNQNIKSKIERFEDPLISLKSYSEKIDSTSVNQDSDFFIKLGNSLLFITRKNLNLEVIPVIEPFFNTKVKEKYWDQEFMSNNISMGLTTQLIKLSGWITNGRRDSRVFNGVQKIGKHLIKFSETLKSISE